MKDIFDSKIMCENCDVQMQKIILNKKGFNLRVLKCPNCEEKIIHPTDASEYENYQRLKEKEFNVKMRMVGNSYAVSIPREIVDFMQDQESNFNNMVRLHLEEMGKLGLSFNEEENQNKRVIKSSEIRLVKNGKLIHAKKYSDSANPKNNLQKIYKKDLNKKTEKDD